MPKMNRTSLTSTQAGGAVEATPRPSSSYRPEWFHHVQAEVTLTADGSLATPAAGTLSVRGKISGAQTFQELGVIDLTAPAPTIFEGFYEAIQAESTSLDGDKTWTLYIVNGG